MPYLLPGALPSFILGSFWTSLGSPFAALLGIIFGPGPIPEAFRGHLAAIFGQFRRGLVSTSILKAHKCQKYAFSGVDYVPET